MEKYQEILTRINQLLKNQDRLIVAIDGMSASGKTTLSRKLSQTYDCNIIHMDDFFLPPDLKTPERLEEVGGNVDYLRFNKEVISGLKSGGELSYNIYNCQSQTLSDQVTLKPKSLYIIEGAYSMHPTLIDNYDLKVFLKIDSKLQKDRIMKRNGPTMYEKFINIWIPMENEYIDKFNIIEKSDIII